MHLNIVKTKVLKIVRDLVGNEGQEIQTLSQMAPCNPFPSPFLKIPYR
jgi:hypothetical protein